MTTPKETTPPNQAQFAGATRTAPSSEADCPMEDLVGHNFRQGPCDQRQEASAPKPAAAVPDFWS